MASGCRGELHTGHCLLVSGEARECPAPDIHGYPTTERLATITTRVQFAPLTAAEIEAYVATGEPLQCAGGFALEGRGGALVEQMELLECDRAELAVAAALAPGDGGQLRSVLACFCGQHRFLVARQRKALPNPRPRSPSRMVCMGFSIGDSPQRDPQLFTATRTLFGRPSAMTSSTPTTIRQRLVGHRPRGARPGPAPWCNQPEGLRFDR